VADEVLGVLSTKLKASQAAISAVEAVLDRCDIVSPGNAPSPIPLRDPGDERVLADAISAGVEILVSGDQDLLVAAEDSPIRILSPRAFLTLARGGTR
jgi:predicted nucleic acid-binding protein